MTDIERQERIVESQRKYRERNREKCNERSRKYREQNPEKVKETNRKCKENRREEIAEYDFERRASLKRKLDLLKMERGCYDCGVMGLPPACYDWDHLPGAEKCFDLARATCTSNLERCLEEISKCQCVCSNCHRIRTKKRKENET